MKTKRLAVAAMVASLLLITGCSLGPWYGNKTDYENGNFKGIANNRDMVEYKKGRIEAERSQLSLDKLKELQPLAPSGKGKGYRGFAINRSKTRDANIIVRGPEIKGFYIAPNDREYYDFIPGVYIATMYDAWGNPYGTPWIFEVSVQQHSFMKEPVHWYLVTPP